MKKRLLFASTILLFITSFVACKKQNEETKPLRAKMIGKWKIDKFETTDPNYIQIVFTASDYIDFKDNPNDDFELSLGANNRQVGTYSSRIDNTIFLDFSSKDLECTIITISPNQFQFKGTIVGSNPKVTETYYLSR